MGEWSPWLWIIRAIQQSVCKKHIILAAELLKIIIEFSSQEKILQTDNVHKCSLWQLFKHVDNLKDPKNHVSNICSIIKREVAYHFREELSAKSKEKVITNLRLCYLGWNETYRGCDPSEGHIWMQKMSVGHYWIPIKAKRTLAMFDPRSKRMLPDVKGRSGKMKEENGKWKWWRKHFYFWKWTI